MNTIPDFLNRKLNPYKEPSKLALAICALTVEQAEFVWNRMKAENPKFKPPKGVVEAKHLLHALANAKAGQAEIILSMIRDTSTVATQTIEKMMGKPITRLAEKTKNSWKTGATASAKTIKVKKGSVLFDGDDVITIVVAQNPKKKGGDPARRFDLYKNGMTVKEAIAAGVFEADVAWDLKHKFITVEKPA